MPQSQNSKILRRLRDFIVDGSEQTYTQRQSYAEAVCEVFQVNDCEQRRDLSALRQIYIYKIASEKNLLRKDVYPDSHFENWLIATIMTATLHIVKFMRIFQTTVAFLKNDISCLELFAIEGKLALPDLIPSPACPLQFASGHPPSSTIIMPFWGSSKKDGDKERLLDREAERRAEENERRKQERAERAEREREAREHERAQRRWEEQQQRAKEMGKIVFSLD
jgi:hypothetical protein